MLIATEFEILRRVPAGTSRIKLPREPLRVATLLNEALFLETGGGLAHWKTVFLEDRVHDWNWREGVFRYYSRVASQADVVVVYSEVETQYCPMCGKQTYPKALCDCGWRAQMLDKT